MHPDQKRAGLVLSSDPARMDIDAIHRYLSEESYWARGIPREIVARSIAHSHCFGVFDGKRQVAFARVVSDRATYAYLCDVYVLEQYRGGGLARWLMETVDSHPDLQGLRRWGLVTQDAHGLYVPHGYVALSRPERHMERTVPNAYLRSR